MGSILGFFHGPLSPSPRVDGSIWSGARSARMTAAARVAGANLIGQRRGHEIVGQGGVMPDLANSPSHILMKVVLPVPHCASSRSTVRPSSAHTILVSCSPNGFRLNMFFSGEKPSFEVDRSLPHQVEVEAKSAQFGEIPGHHAEFGIELHPHRHHPIAAH